MGQQAGTATQASLPNQAAVPPAPQNRTPFHLISSARPVPMPRTRAPLTNLIAAPQPGPFTAAPSGLIQVLPPPAPAALPLNPEWYVPSRG